MTAGMTAFYMTRLIALTFWGVSRVSRDVHESPPIMTFPLVALGVLSLIGGWVGIPHVISAILPGHLPHVLQQWLAPVLKNVALENPSAIWEWGLMGASVLLAMVCAQLAYYCYIKNPEQSKVMATKMRFFYDLVYNKYWVDEFYFGKIINPLVEMSKGLWFYIDVNLIDKITYVLSDFIKNCGGGLRALQNGNMQQYAMYIVLGLIGIMTIVLMG